MEDTPQHIKNLQLKIWLSKSPGERLLQLLKDNEELYLFWKKGKEALSKATLSKLSDGDRQTGITSSPPTPSAT